MKKVVRCHKTEEIILELSQETKIDAIYEKI